jgi:hypothetical protein
MCPLQYRRAKSKGAPGLAFETWDPSNQFPLETPTLLFVIRSEAEGSAVSLQVYSHPLLRASRAASIRLAAPNLLIASDK